MPDCAGPLRRSLSEHAVRWAKDTGLPHYTSKGKSWKVVLFEECADGAAHGNFEAASWRAIKASKDWAGRLQKAHSQKSALPVEKQPNAKELDSCNSSDALLMNCFCHPGAADQLLDGLGFKPSPESPVFGFRGKVPFVSGAKDVTEIDMRIGQYLVEAKLTERTFTSKAMDHVAKYRNLADVFDLTGLETDNGAYCSYQLIRNVLAAHAHGMESVVLIDQRRDDLRTEWERVMGAIRLPELRSRCHLRTWQQVAGAAPPSLRTFLAVKYGIQPEPRAGHAPHSA